MNLPHRLRDIIINSYEFAAVNIISRKGSPGMIDIKRGVKQGCSLSPRPLNTCIDPLLRRLNDSDVEKYSFRYNNKELDNLTAQAYADDILIFSNSYDDLTKLMMIVYDFLIISKISLNPKK
jgi:hypothetical protein